MANFIFGIILVLIALAIVWFNERRAVKMGALIDKAKVVIRKDVKVEDIDDGLDLNLIHCKAKLDGKAVT